MPRTKTGNVRRKGHKKVFELAKGFRMSRNRLYKVASEAVVHAGQYSFAGRKQKKRQFREIWIERINAALSSIEGASNYSTFISSLKTKNSTLNRKSLSALAVNLPEAFKAVVSFTNSK